MKSQGLFKNSMILVHADHGYTVRYLNYEHARELPILEQAMPLLLIKPFDVDDSAEMTSSRVPAALIDLPKTITDAAGIDESFPGVSILKLASGEQRVRFYRDYGWHNDFWGDAYLPKMQEYEISGDIRDGNSWKRTRRLASPK